MKLFLLTFLNGLTLAGQAPELTTRRLLLGPGATASLRLDGEETIVVVQDGSGTLAAGSEQWQVGRKGVFSERATALYVPAGVEMRASAAPSMLEAVLFSTRATPGGSPALIGPEQVVVASRGDVRYEFRHMPVDSSCNPFAPKTVHPHACEASRAVEAAAFTSSNSVSSPEMRVFTTTS